VRYPEDERLLWRQISIKAHRRLPSMRAAHRSRLAFAAVPPIWGERNVKHIGNMLSDQLTRG
jgi:hypothetical protein